MLPLLPFLLPLLFSLLHFLGNLLLPLFHQFLLHFLFLSLLLNPGLLLFLLLLLHHLQPFFLLPLLPPHEFFVLLDLFLVDFEDAGAGLPVRVDLVDALVHIQQLPLYFSGLFPQETDLALLEFLLVVVGFEAMLFDFEPAVENILHDVALAVGEEGEEVGVEAGRLLLQLPAHVVPHAAEVVVAVVQQEVVGTVLAVLQQRPDLLPSSSLTSATRLYFSLDCWYSSRRGFTTAAVGSGGLSSLRNSDWVTSGVWVSSSGCSSIDVIQI